MSAPIEVTLTSRPVERVEGEIVVVGFFAGERPLRGAAGRTDWRLCGGLSRRIESGDLSGKSGEALLIGCGRALVAPRLLLLGLGDREAFDQLRVSDNVHQAVDRCLKIGCPRIALSPLGIAGDDIPRHASALVAGIRDASHSSSDPLRLQISVPSAEMAGVRRAFDDARAAANATEFTIRAPELDVSRP